MPASTEQKRCRAECSRQNTKRKKLEQEEKARKKVIETQKKKKKQNSERLLRKREEVTQTRDQLNPKYIVCSHCSAICFAEEQNDKSKGELYCCHKGVVPLDIMRIKTPPEIRDLLQNRDFRRNIRRYNGIFCFTSTRANLDKSLANAADGIYTFRISGTVQHIKVDNLIPSPEKRPRFSQLYIYDPDYQLKLRKDIFPRLDSTII